MQNNFESTRPARYQGSPELGVNTTVAQTLDELAVSWAQKLFPDAQDCQAAHEILTSSACRSLIIPAKVCGFAGMHILQAFLLRAKKEKRGDG